jgi:hypothetical protein
MQIRIEIGEKGTKENEEKESTNIKNILYTFLSLFIPCNSRLY